MLDFVLLILPSIEARLKRVAVSNPHPIYSWSDCIYFIFAYAICATLKSEARL